VPLDVQRVSTAVSGVSPRELAAYAADEPRPGYVLDPRPRFSVIMRSVGFSSFTLVVLVLVMVGCTGRRDDPSPPPSADAGLDGGGAPVDDGGLPPLPDAGPDMACDPLVPRAGATRVEVLPEDGPDGLLGFLEGAEASIDVAIYLLGDDGAVTDTLRRMAGRVRVRVLYEKDKTWASTARALEAAGAETRSEPSAFHEHEIYGPFYHPKFAIVDGRRVWLSTGNLLEDYMLTERNYDVYLDDPHDVADFREIFEADWERRTPELSCTRLVVSPANARERVLELIDGAESSLFIESMQFRDPEVRSHVAARHAAGVDVRVVLADGCWIDDNLDAAAFLSSAGMVPRWMGEYSAHVKMIVADGARAYVGSVNLSTNSLDRNREVGVILTDAESVELLGRSFIRDFNRASFDWSVFPSICEG
jgi:phosphatidylserine/phosphatidylglycerophosphate/cardiolipin synthase-like enzyme